METETEDSYVRPYRDENTPLTPEQLALRKDVYRVIVTQPRQFRMDSWEVPHGGEGCKTTRCVAGWARFIARGKVYGDGSIEHDAIRLLGLTRADYLGDSAHLGDDDVLLYDELFYTSEADATERMRKLAGEDA